VITAFGARWDVTVAEADALFEDVLAWLWIASRPDAPPLGIDAPMRIVDEMWHELMLHTRTYAALCERWFGGFVHHEPDAPRLRAAGPATPIDRAPQWRHIGTELGLDRLLRWYVELPLRHDDAWFRRARRAHDFGYQPSPELIGKWQARK